MSTEPVSKFVEDYRRVRLAEGYASTDPAFARQLPFRDTTGRNAAAWRLRALHYLVIRAGLALAPGVRRVLDVGAGQRLAGAAPGRLVRGDGGGRRRRRHRPAIARRSPRGARARRPAGAAAGRRQLRRRGRRGRPPLRRRPGGRARRAGARASRARASSSSRTRPSTPTRPSRDAAWRRSRDYYAAAGAAHLADRYRGLVRDELARAGLFRFVTVATGLPSLDRGLRSIAVARARARRPPARAVRLEAVAATGG